MKVRLQRGATIIGNTHVTQHREHQTDQTRGQQLRLNKQTKHKIKRVESR